MVSHFFSKYSSVLRLLIMRYHLFDIVTYRPLDSRACTVMSLCTPCQVYYDVPGILVKITHDLRLAEI